MVLFAVEPEPTVSSSSTRPEPTVSSSSTRPKPAAPTPILPGPAASTHLQPKPAAPTYGPPPVLAAPILLVLPPQPQAPSVLFRGPSCSQSFVPPAPTVKAFLPNKPSQPRGACHVHNCSGQRKRLFAVEPEPTVSSSSTRPEPTVSSSSTRPKPAAPTPILPGPAASTHLQPKPAAPTYGPPPVLAAPILLVLPPQPQAPSVLFRGPSCSQSFVPPAPTVKAFLPNKPSQPRGACHVHNCSGQRKRLFAVEPEPTVSSSSTRPEPTVSSSSTRPKPAAPTPILPGPAASTHLQPKPAAPTYGPPPVLAAPILLVLPPQPQAPSVLFRGPSCSQSFVPPAPTVKAFLPNKPSQPRGACHVHNCSGQRKRLFAVEPEPTVSSSSTRPEPTVSSSSTRPKPAAPTPILPGPAASTHLQPKPAAPTYGPPPVLAAPILLVLPPQPQAPSVLFRGPSCSQSFVPPAPTVKAFLPNKPSQPRGACHVHNCSGQRKRLFAVEPEPTVSSSSTRPEPTVSSSSTRPKPAAPTPILPGPAASTHLQPKPAAPTYGPPPVLAAPILLVLPPQPQAPSVLFRGPSCSQSFVPPAPTVKAFLPNKPSQPRGACHVHNCSGQRKRLFAVEPEPTVSSSSTRPEPTVSSSSTRPKPAAPTPILPGPAASTHLQPKPAAPTYGPPPVLAAPILLVLPPQPQAPSVLFRGPSCSQSFVPPAPTVKAFLPNKPSQPRGACHVHNCSGQRKRLFAVEPEPTVSSSSTRPEPTVSSSSTRPKPAAPTPILPGPAASTHLQPKPAAPTYGPPPVLAAPILLVLPPQPQAPSVLFRGPSCSQSFVPPAPTVKAFLPNKPSQPRGACHVHNCSGQRKRYTPAKDSGLKHPEDIILLSIH
ncbi:basic proline-rich protein-like [Sardina pilchardus]|uniref:basic proline-rich protein-like n=1 Tax=Sardina pilchardus TaxID=27697 RepID=UPI002E0E41ED